MNMKKHTIIILTISALLLSACGQQAAASNESSSETAVSTATASTAASTEASAEPDPPDDTMSSNEAVSENEAVSSNEAVSNNSTPSENAITTSENSLPFEIKMLDTPETKYTKQSVNLRKGPSTSDYAVITTLPINQQVTTDYKVTKYKDSTLEWYHVVYTKKDGTTEDGYISAKYLSDSKTSTASSKSKSSSSASSSASTGKTPTAPVQTPAASTDVSAPPDGWTDEEGEGCGLPTINNGDLDYSGGYQNLQ